MATGEVPGYKPSTVSPQTRPGSNHRPNTLPGSDLGGSDPFVEQTVNLRTLGPNLNAENMYRAELAKAKASGYRPSRYEREFARELGISAERFMEIEIRREAQEAYSRGITIEALQEEKRLARLSEEQANQTRQLEDARKALDIIHGGTVKPPRNYGNSNRALPGSEGFSGLPASPVPKPCPRSSSRGRCVSPQYSLPVRD